MKYWDDFLNEVMPYVENCPLPVAKHQIINATIEFCQRTALWRRELDPISLSATVHTYPVCDEVSADETISSLDFAFLTETDGETPLGVTTEDVMKENIYNWRTATAQKPQAVMLPNTESIRVYPIPEVATLGSLVVGVILKPSREAAGIPDWIHEQYAEKIACGAKAKLFAMKSRSWYDAQESNDEQDNFDMAIKDATIRTNKGNSRINLSVKQRPLA